MAHFWIKTMVSALLIAGISELGKRSPLMAGILASLPITSLLAFVWLYTDTRDTNSISELSISILWLVIPSLLLFLALPALLRRQIPFYLALLIACALTAMAYGVTIFMVQKLGFLQK